MRKGRYTAKQRLAILGKQDNGQSVDEICRSHQISPATFYKWKKELKENEDASKRKMPD